MRFRVKPGMTGEVEVGEVFATGREVVMNQIGKNLLELQEKLLAWEVIVREHGEMKVES